MEEIYYPRKRKKSILFRLFKLYLLCVLLRLLVLEYGVRIIEIRDSENSLFREYAGTKVLALSSPYIISFFAGLKINRRRAPEPGDIVLLHSLGHAKMKFIQRLTVSLMEALTLGIVKEKNRYVFRKVTGIPGQSLSYTSRELLSSVGSSPAVLPFFDSRGQLTLKEDEVFLLGTRNYELDSRLLGPVALSAIKGRAVLLLHPHWQSIATIPVE